MIPMYATLRIGRGGRPGIPLWIPLFLVWLLLLPFLLLAAPVASMACLGAHVNPYRAWRVLWGLLDGVRGARVEAVNRHFSVFVRVV